MELGEVEGERKKKERKEDACKARGRASERVVRPGAKGFRWPTGEQSRQLIRSKMATSTNGGPPFYLVARSTGRIRP